MKPRIAAKIKNRTILISTNQMFTSLLLKLVMIVKAIIPRTSSIIAAPRIALLAGVFNLPSSFSVSTVIETEVAVRTTPMKIDFSNLSWLLGSSISSNLQKHQR